MYNEVTATQFGKQMKTLYEGGRRHAGCKVDYTYTRWRSRPCSTLKARRGKIPCRPRPKPRWQPIDTCAAPTTYTPWTPNFWMMDESFASSTRLAVEASPVIHFLFVAQGWLKTWTHGCEPIYVFLLCLLFDYTNGIYIFRKLRLFCIQKKIHIWNNCSGWNSPVVVVYPVL
jgi:hypothetical protein